MYNLIPLKIKLFVQIKFTELNFAEIVKQISNIVNILFRKFFIKKRFFALWLQDFNILLNDLNVNFDILAITESCLKKDLSSPVNLHLNNYSIEQNPTETSAGGTLLYKSKRPSYQLRNDLKLYHPGKTESTFIEIICSKSTNVMIGCIYK